MKNNIKLFAGLIIFLGILYGAFAYIHHSSQIPENPDNEVGNTAGNLNNDGLFCEKDGKVYFSNPYDLGSLYSMNEDGSDIKKLNKYQSKWINVAGDYIYYYEAADGSNSIAGFGGHMMGLYRSNLDGKKTKCLDKTSSMIISLYGNYLYYQHYSNRNKEGMTLYKMHIDKKDSGMLVKEIINPSCIVNGNIYYPNYSGQHGMYRYNTASNASTGTKVFDAAVFNPIVMPDGDTVYYMNINDDYRIYRGSISSGEEVRLTEERADCFNISSSYIFYQKNDATSPALMRCRLDGSQPEEIISGNYKNINVTGSYVYFMPYESNNMLYKTPANAPGSAQPCTEFADAIPQK